MTVYLDILNFTQTKDFLKEYIDVQLGNTPLNKNDHNKDITQVIAERRRILQEQCEKELNREMNEIVQENKEKWLDCLLNSEIYKNIENKNSRNYFPDEINKQIDYARKYIVQRCKYPDVEFPENLQNLVDAQKVNEVRLKELKNIKNRNAEEKNEYNKRIKYRKSLNEDIQELKRHYGYEYSNGSNEKESYSFDEEFDIEEYEINQSILDSFDLEKINIITKENLTNKQLIIFKLYYEGGLTQQEIADIIGTTRENVTLHLGVILKKIKIKIAD